METIKKIRQIAKSRRKTIVFSESDDRRVTEACRIIEEEGIARVILLTPDKINLPDQEKYIQEFHQLRQHKGLDIDTARKIFTNPLYYAAMMVRNDKADGFVAGASNTTPDVARAAIWCLGVDKRMGIASSAFIMVVPDCTYGEKGTFVFADCGIVPEPTAQQLAYISIAAANLTKKVLGLTPRIALLSYSTHGSSGGKNVEKVKAALKLIKEMAADLLVDGELQLDAAIVPEVARIKSPESPLAGKANILIFPNLEAGNIGYKLLQRLGKALALGPLILGLNKPCSDLSRGCSVEDIVDCAAVISIIRDTL